MTRGSPPHRGPRRAGARPRCAEREGGGADPIDAALEAIGAPAFLVREGEVERANAAGAALLEREAAETRARLAARGEGCVTRIQVPGVSGYALVVLPDRSGHAVARAAAAARRWGLTARHRDVLALLATGASNREIGRALRCSEKTVEAHVSSILARAAAASRSELIARFWSTDV